MAGAEGTGPAPEKVEEGPEAAFTQPNDFSDVILVVEGKRLYTSKYVLSQLSPVFRTMFTAEFKEKNSNEVELPGKKYQDVLDLLLYTKPSSRMEMTGNLALRIYSLFHEYEMVPEKERCIKALLDYFKQEIGQSDKFSAAFHRACVQLACTYELPELYQVCVDVAIDHPSSHYDALIDNTEKTPAKFLAIVITKLKRTAYDHRNGKQFRSRSERPCDAYMNPSNCVDYRSQLYRKTPDRFDRFSRKSVIEKEPDGY